MALTGDGCTDDGDKLVGGIPGNPFPDLVVESRDAGCGGVGAFLEDVKDLFVGDGKAGTGQGGRVNVRRGINGSIPVGEP